MRPNWPVTTQIGVRAPRAVPDPLRFDAFPPAMELFGLAMGGQGAGRTQSVGQQIEKFFRASMLKIASDRVRPLGALGHVPEG